MLAIVGFIMIGILIVALVKFNCLPITVFSTLPLIAALIVGSGVSGSMTMLAKGIIQVLPTAALFVGSITYFGIMNDVGLFDRPISMLSKRIKPNVFSVLAIASSVAMIAHLDGSGVATLLITVPAFLPIVKGLKIRVMPFSFIVTMCIGVMNFLPWGGPIGRAATVVGSDAVTLWKTVLPVQIFGILLVYVACFLISRQEVRKGYFVYQPDVRVSLRELSQEELELRRPKLFWFNLLLTVMILVMLFIGIPAFIPFLMGIGLALPVNYGKGGEKAQSARIKAHAKNVLPMIITIIGAGMLLGVITDTGMVNAMAKAIVGVIPKALGPFIHIIMGILAVPLSLVFDPDTLNYGILPVISAMGQAYGITPTQSALAIAIGHNMGVGLCMTSASVYFGLGMFGLEYKEAFKYSFVKSLLFCAALIIFGAIIGVL
ncbi:SLC13 family permease [Anaerocolumna sp. AGMB13025]|uniref:SLC13 family permease n=1 Tax=Anaerocolumna sp. AGMB13025 TaxID=3039116 RepID=UPI00241CC19B|nr:SLC13 family permease [Anaerocolumna sp. AGMB13025]WFR57647.1 SLC13 family permease [Anaerocolumna sp. AGMB13025]